jgi:type II secretory pathway component PulK
MRSERTSMRRNDRATRGTGGLPVVRRGGFILITMLIFIAAMLMLSAAFALNSTANLEACQANANLVQARQAAEAGIYYVMRLLRDPKNLADMSVWHDNREQFFGGVVWSSSDSATGFARGIDIPKGQKTWRFSIVAGNAKENQSEIQLGGNEGNDQNNIRYGITDEASKLNLNTANEKQLRRLFEKVIVGEDVSIDELVASFLDWRDSDTKTRTGGAEDDYYQSLPTPYRCKNGALSTIEELLLIKGFTAQIVYGEDINRNGLLEINEDDGEERTPEYDNGDGQLNRGLLPYVTVFSWDRNVANDNTQRINLNDKDTTKLHEKLLAVKELDPLVADFIVQYRQGGKKFKSRSELIGMEGSGGGPNPVQLEHLPVLMDRTTVDGRPAMGGLININTASAEVLESLGVFTEEEASAIVDTRQSLEPEAKLTIAWPLTENIVSKDTFAKAEPFLTARSMQFMVESIGFADHTGTFKRIQAVIEVIGPISQIRYYRDLSVLGIGYPVHPVAEGKMSFASSGS